MSRKFIILFFTFMCIIHALIAQVSSTNEINIDYNAAKEYTIGGITVSGIKYLDGNVLIMLSGLTVGEKIKVPGDKITLAVKKLWEQGLFEDVRISVTKIEDNNVYLDIYLKERARLSRFSFSGISKSDADNIREKIKIVSGDYVTDNLLLKTKNIILKYYHDKGYLNADVNITQKKDTSSANQVTLQIDIDRNGRIKIYDINVNNNSQLSDEQVAAAFKKTKEKSVFNPMDDMDKVVYKSAVAAVNMDFVEIGSVVEQQGVKRCQAPHIQVLKIYPGGL
jgi:outer membrane protein insertion porin family